MDLRRLEMFLAVLDHDGFTAGADALRVAQPAVSLAVKELEREVGTPLLVRSRHGVTLTAAGEALVGPARQALRAVETAEAAVAAVTGLVAGHLDVVSLPTLAADPVAELVGRFRQAHPQVQVRLAAPDEAVDLAGIVRSGAAEIGITEAGPNNRGLVEVVLGTQELLAVSPPGSPTSPLRLDRLGPTPLVLTPVGSSLRDLVTAALHDADVVGEVAVETAQREALIPLVLAGAGTTFLPDRLALAARSLGASVRPTSPRLRRDVVLVHRAEALGPAAAAFAHEAQER